MRESAVRPRALRPKSVLSLVLTLSGLTRLEAFLLAPRLPFAASRASAQASFRSPTIRSLSGICSHPAASQQLLSRMKATSSKEDQGEGEAGQDGPADVANECDDGAAPAAKDFRILVATAATGALLGWSVARSLDLDLDLVGAMAGCLVSVGLLAQKGAVGKFTAILGEFALGAFEVVGVVLESSDVPAKVVGTVGEELLEVVEFTSGAVTKGYLDSLPPVEKRLQEEIDASKKKAEDFKDQLKKANAALSEARGHLAQRAENRRVVDAAKATAAELAEAKNTLLQKDAEISESLRLAGQEKEKFSNELEAARAETLRFREILDSKMGMDDGVKALTEASESLEGRIRDYEDRLQILTQENDAIRADYAAEIENMEAERTAMRTRVSGLETSLYGAESQLEQQRAMLEKELALMADALEQRTTEVESAARTTEEMRNAVERLEAERSAALERAIAEASRRALEEERARAGAEIEALKSEAAAALEVERKGKVSAVAEFERRERELEQQLKKLGQRLEELEREGQRSIEMPPPIVVEEAKGGRKRKGVSRPVPKSMAREEKQHPVVREEAVSRAEEAEAMGEMEKQQREAAAPAVMSVEAEQVGTAAAGAGASAAGPSRPGTSEAKAEGSGGLPKSRSGLMKLTVKDLREHCRGAGVPTTGKKTDLVERLLESVASA